MKQIYIFSLAVLVFFLSTFSIKVKAQISDAGWTTSMEYPKTFIENKGQFPYMLNANTNKEGILYGVDNASEKIYFTKNGVIYNFVQAKEKEEDELEKGKSSFEEWEEKEEKAKHKEYKLDEISFIWENSNPDVEVIAEDLQTDYYSYTFKENNAIKNVNFIKGYKKITYKNLYTNIDVVYTFHPTEGIKYALILHPGADISKIKMTYSDQATIATNGDLHISTLFGDIIDHAPVSFYTDNTSSAIKSSFVKTGNSIGFSLDSYDNLKSVTIDPWIVSPTFNTSTAAWEVETDASGNVYIIGGETPMKLQKYNSAGTIQWTYTTPWDTATVWLGTLATDNLGNSFITSGTAPEIERIDNGGTMIWHNASGGIFSLTEWWSITFNCDKTKLIVGGTGGSVPPLGTPKSVIYNIDINSGNVIGSVDVHVGASGGLGGTPIEVRSISSSKNAQYIFLTHLHVGAINDNIGACPQSGPIYKVDNGYNLGYKCENYLPASQNGGGLKALVANDQFFYTHSGDQIHKWNLSTGAFISSAAIPGGASSTVPIVGGLVVENSGLAVDNCGNVYAGSTNQVIKYDANLNILAQSPTTFCVYDVSVNSNGEVIAVGAQSDNSATNRNGKIQSLSMSACAQYALVCCDANVCPADTVCSTDPAFNLSSSSSGGTWSGTGITNASTGTFDPSVSGPGTFTITYTKACGSGSVTIQVNACSTLSICEETNGNLTVTGGTGPYNWEEYNAATLTPITNQTECVACGGTWTPFVNICMIGGMPTTDCPTPAFWSNFATGTTVTPPVGADTIRVTDSFSNTVTLYNLTSVPPCSGCPALTISTSSIVNVCSGSSTGSFNASTSGGASPYDYILVNGVGTTVATFNNIIGTQSFTGLPSGTYTINVTDNNSCTGSNIITIAVNPQPTVTVTPNPVTICTGNNVVLTASGATNYSWSPGIGLSSTTGTSVTANPGSSTTYTITGTDGNGCSGTTSVSVTVTSSISANAGNDTTVCTGSSVTLLATGGASYQWSPSTGLSCTNCQSPVATPPNTTIYTVTVSSGSCTPATDAITVTVTPLPVISVTPNTTTICSGNSVTITANGGTTYSWSPAAGLNTTSGSTVIASPTTTTTYTVTGTLSGCSSTSIIVVTVLPGVTANAGPDVNLCTGDSTVLTASGGTTYSWSPATGLSSTSGSTVTADPIVTTTYTVTVSNATCSATDAVIVSINTIPVASIAGDTTLCTGSSTLLTASGGLSYVWSTTDTTQTISVNPSSGTTYIVTVSNAGCSSTASITIDLTIPPTANAGNDTTINIGGSAQLDGSGGIGFSWSPIATLSCSNCPDPIASPISTTIYVLMVTDTNGCTNVDTVIVTVDMECGEVFVPNAFSPNKDGKNELECVFGNCIQTMEFAIFDRWGAKVFETTDPKSCWDGVYKGKELNTGAFVYYLKATLYNGTEVNKQGNINLFR